MKKIYKVFILTILLALGLFNVSSAQTPGVVACVATGTWVNASGVATTTPPAAAPGTAYQVKATFDSATCAGKGQAEIVLLLNGAQVVTSGKKDITASNLSLIQPVATTQSGSYTWAVKFYPTGGGAAQTTPSSAPLTVGAGGGGNNNNSGGITPPVDTGGSTGGVIGTISNPISYDSLGGLVVGIIRFLLTMLGGLAVLFIIIGAVRMVTSAGNEKAVGAGKQTVQWAVIGLITALMAFSIISLVQSVIGRK